MLVSGALGFSASGDHDYSCQCGNPWANPVSTAGRCAWHRHARTAAAQLFRRVGNLPRHPAASSRPCFRLRRCSCPCFACTCSPAGTPWCPLRDSPTAPSVESLLNGVLEELAAGRKDVPARHQRERAATRAVAVAQGARRQAWEPGKHCPGVCRRAPKTKGKQGCSDGMTLTHSASSPRSLQSPRGPADRRGSRHHTAWVRWALPEAALLGTHSAAARSCHLPPPVHTTCTDPICLSSGPCW